MDGPRFDRITKGLAGEAGSRRLMVKALMSAVVGGVALGAPTVAFASKEPYATIEAGAAGGICGRGRKRCSGGCCPRRAPKCCGKKGCCKKGYTCGRNACIKK